MAAQGRLKKGSSRPFPPRSALPSGQPPPHNARGPQPLEHRPAAARRSAEEERRLCPSRSVARGAGPGPLTAAVRRAAAAPRSAPGAARSHSAVRARGGVCWCEAGGGDKAAAILGLRVDSGGGTAARG